MHLTYYTIIWFIQDCEVYGITLLYLVIYVRYMHTMYDVQPWFTLRGDTGYAMVWVVVAMLMNTWCVSKEHEYMYMYYVGTLAGKHPIDGLWVYVYVDKTNILVQVDQLF